MLAESMATREPQAEPARRHGYPQPSAQRRGGGWAPRAGAVGLGSLLLVEAALGMGPGGGAAAFCPPGAGVMGALGRGRGLRTAVGPVMMARKSDKLKGQDYQRKKVAQREDDPAERALIERQKVLTTAMGLLQKWDEEQFAFVQENTDRNAPLGDWRGLRRELTSEEREEMRRACRTLADDARYVCLGLNAETEDIAVRSLHEWLTGLGLPAPEQLTLTDDASAFEYGSKDEMSPAVLAAFTGPMHIGYNSKAGADPVTGDETNAPPAASMMPYPAPDRGVVFTPILEGFFTQYGDVPLDLFAPDEEVEARRAAGEVSAAYDPDVVLRQHAALGNEAAIKELQEKEQQKLINMEAGDPQAF